MNPAAETLLDHAPPAVKQAWNQRIRWRLAAHPFQIPPEGDWRWWMMKAGRGAGKTRTGAQDAVESCMDNHGWRYAVVAPTQGDVRATCFEGESGIISVLREMGVDYEWHTSRLELELGNGSTMFGYSAEKPDRLRGPQFHRAWVDEAGSFKDAKLGDALNTTFNNLSLGLRLGEDARGVITTTPKQVALIRELVGRDDCKVTSGTTYDNIDNLSATFAASLAQYEGTRIGRQELLAELLEDIEGALWTQAGIDIDRVTNPDLAMQIREQLAKVYVGVDPSGGTAEIGIVAAGLIRGVCPVCPGTEMQHFAVLADMSLHGSPNTWGTAAVRCYEKEKADRIIGERNFGGDMVESTIRNVDRSVSYEDTTSSRGKLLRAEPVAALYEQHRVHHVGAFPQLEDEMTTWTQDGGWSPNRLDAMVFAMTKAMGGARSTGGVLRDRSVMSL